MAQQYITNPLLWDGLKFDIRIYVLMFGVAPLRLFIFNDGLVRFATEPYSEPNDINQNNLFMHLTNYAINKNNEKFVENNEPSDCEEEEEEPHKRSFLSLLVALMKKGCDIRKIRQEINDIIIKTCIVGVPSMAHIYRSCQLDDVENSLCF